MVHDNSIHLIFSNNTDHSCSLKCPECGRSKSKCLWLVYGGQIRRCMIKVKKESPRPPNTKIRHEGYKKAAKLIFGSLGKGNRKKLPDCVEGEIKNLYPAGRGEAYVGFKSIR